MEVGVHIRVLIQPIVLKKLLLKHYRWKKIEYYKRTLPYRDYIYRVYLETDNSGYLLNATAEDIAAIRLIGQTGIIEVSEITIVPFYVEIIIGFIILIIPFGSRRKRGECCPCSTVTTCAICITWSRVQF